MNPALGTARIIHGDATHLPPGAACRHEWITRRLGSWPAYWICDCGQNFRDLGGNPRQHPVDPPTIERNGNPAGAV